MNYCYVDLMKLLGSQRLEVGKIAKHLPVISSFSPLLSQVPLAELEEMRLWVRFGSIQAGSGKPGRALRPCFPEQIVSFERRRVGNPRPFLTNPLINNSAYLVHTQKPQSWSHVYV